MEKQTKTTTATTQTKASKATASKKSKQAKKPAYVDSVQALRNKKPIKIDLPASVEFDSNGGIITADNVTAYGERIAVRALKTCITSGKGYTAESAKKARENGKNINASGNFNFIYGLYTGLIADITARKNDTARPLSDGYDIAQTATAFLCDYIGKNINDPADTDEKNKDTCGARRARGSCYSVCSRRARCARGSCHSVCSRRASITSDARCSGRTYGARISARACRTGRACRSGYPR